MAFEEGIEIESLNPTALPNALHEMAAQKDGLTIKLKVQQIMDLTAVMLRAGAPAGLDTFDEVAAAIGDDPEFFSTTAAALALKAPLLNPTLTDSILDGVSGQIIRGFKSPDALIANDTTDATNDIFLRACSIASVDAMPVLMTQASDLIKRLDANFVAGNNQGMLDQGSVGNGSYHLHNIRNPTSGAVDVIASLSHDRKSVATITIASPGVVTWNDHGLQAGATVKFTTTGALPTGLSANTYYYVSATGLTANSFRLSATNGGAAINTTGSQSGVHTVQATPFLPAGFTQFKRRCSILRESGVNVPIRNPKVGLFRRASVAAISGVTPYASLLTDMKVPIGVPLQPIVQVNASVSASSSAFVSMGDALDGSANLPVFNVGSSLSAGYQIVPSIFTTDAFGKLYTAMAGTGTINAFTIATYGWNDGGDQQ